MGRCLQIQAKMPSRAPVPIKISTSSSLHTCACVFFASVVNLVMPVSKKGFEARAATVFEKKVAKLFDNVGNQLFNKLNISGIFLL